MTVVGFHASHEQAPPSELLNAVRRAEEVGFDAAMCSDHFAPWSVRQGQSGYSWSWLGAAMASTRLPFGVVNAPGQRAHPAIVAQAIATLGEMFPGRFRAALGSGENANEHITGDAWPAKEVRDARLRASVDVIRRLLQGETVTTSGLVDVHEARIWSLPEAAPELHCAAVSPETARAGAAWADGLITAVQPAEKLAAVLSAYRDAGGRGPASLQVHLSWADDADDALALAHDQWRHALIAPPELWDISSPEEFDRRTEHVTPEQVAEKVFVSSDVDAHISHLRELADLGFDELHLHHVGRDQEAFLTRFGRDVLPELKGTR